MQDFLNRYTGGKNFVYANTFHDAAVSFLSEPWVSAEDIEKLGEKGLACDASVVTSLATNSSIWVIGSFIPLDKDGKPIEDYLYYRLAAGLTYSSTPDGTFINFIQSFHSDGTHISSLLWDTSLLKFPTGHKCPVGKQEKSINSHRLDILLLSFIKELCQTEKSSSDLYLQCDYRKQLFSKFITIGWFLIFVKTF